MHGFSFISRQRETEIHRQTEEKQIETGRPQIAKRWREIDMGIKTQRKKPK